VYEKSDFMSLKLKIITNWLYALYFETPYEEIKYLKQSLEMDDQRALEYYILGARYNKLYLYDKSIPEFERSLKLYDKWSSKPAWVYNYTSLGYAYHKTDRYKKEKKLYERAEQDFPDDPDLIRRQSILALSKGKTDAANEYIDKYITIRKGNSVSEADLASSLGSIYQEAEVLDKAEEFYRQTLSLEPDNTERMNSLAYFLIDKDRDINLGKELIEKALNLKPDDYIYMHTKGLGLLHQGKYQEALEILQKSWDLRIKNSIYDHEAFLHLEAAKKAVSGLKDN